MAVLLCSPVGAQRKSREDWFRPPAIPLFTSDPYMQTWLFGDSPTNDTVRHWDGRPKQMAGLARVDGTTYRFLGGCDGHARGSCPPPLRLLSPPRVTPSLTSFRFAGPGVELTVEFLATPFEVLTHRDKRRR